jgi:two-component system LytT family response regulator
MKKCLIIDDERNARETLQKMIQRYFKSHLEVCGLASSVKEGVDIIKKKKPDVVFLDIEMPGEDGLQLFKYFDEITFEVIFTTAYEQYAIRAIKYSALDYILKPINQIELGEAINKITDKDKLKLKTTLHIETLLHNMNIDSDGFSKVALPTKEGYELEQIRNIVYCQADVNYCKIYTVTNNYIYVSRPLKFIEEILPKTMFFRTHKSFLVNLNYIKRFNRINGGKVVLESGEILPVSTRNCDSLIKRINKK